LARFISSTSALSLRRSVEDLFFSNSFRPITM